jgi:hypothetical protein
MIQQLVLKIAQDESGNLNPDQSAIIKASGEVLGADPIDLMLCMEQVWSNWSGSFAITNGARQNLLSSGYFESHFPVSSTLQQYDHLIYAYVLENTRAIQIMRRVVREFRSGEALGVPSPDTSRWLDATEALLFGANDLLSAWLSTSHVRPNPESVRRNAYWRLLGMELAFGDDDNRPVTYDKASAANTTFTQLFEELLYELWQAIANIKNSSGVNETDDDRIYRLGQELGYVLNVRRQGNVLDRVELAAAVVAGWIDVTLRYDSPLVVDLRAQATSPDERLRLVGERVGLTPHSKSTNFFAMASDLSLILRTIEFNVVDEPGRAWILYANSQPTGPGYDPSGAKPLGEESKRVITEWSAATGRRLKHSALPTQVSVAPPTSRRPAAIPPPRAHPAQHQQHPAPVAVRRDHQPV